MPDLEHHFQPAWGGVFLSRNGISWSPDRKCSQKKLCFTATDKAFLIQFLFELSERPGCHYVKLSVEPRDGMYLCRCFAVDDETAGRWWTEFKPHDKLMCNLQDDDFIDGFRDWEAINAQRLVLNQEEEAGK